MSRMLPGYLLIRPWYTDALLRNITNVLRSALFLRATTNLYIRKRGGLFLVHTSFLLSIYSTIFCTIDVARYYSSRNIKYHLTENSYALTWWISLVQLVHYNSNRFSIELVSRVSKKCRTFSIRWTNSNLSIVEINRIDKLYDIN